MAQPVDGAGWAERVSARFQAEFGGTPRVFFAPGRVSLSGAHLDYNGGDVLPMAVDRGIWVAAGKSVPTAGEPPMVRCRSLNKPRHVDVPLSEIGDQARSEDGWAAYPLGVLKVLFETLGLSLEAAPCGFDFVVGGDLAMASGMSSSAALEVAVAFALAQLRPFSASPAASILLIFWQYRWIIRPRPVLLRSG